MHDTKSPYQIGAKVRIRWADKWQRADGFEPDDVGVIDDLDDPDSPDADWIYVLLCRDHRRGAWFSHHDLEVFLEARV